MDGALVLAGLLIGRKFRFYLFYEFINSSNRFLKERIIAMENTKPKISSRQSGMKVTIQPHPSQTSSVKADKPTGQAITIAKRQEKANARGIQVTWEKVRTTPVSTTAYPQEKEGRQASQEAIAGPIRQTPSFTLGRADKKQQVIEWSSPNNPFVQRRLKMRPSNVKLGQLLLSIAAAIVVGLIMGFSILRIFFMENASHSARSIDDHLPKSNMVAEIPLTDANGNKAKGKEVGSPLPALKVVMLQAGNFQNKQHAQKKVQEYRTQGMAAVMSDHPPYRIFLGMGWTRDEALKLSAIYQKKDVEVYLKELQMTGTLPEKWKQREQLARLLVRGNHLIQQLGNAAIVNIQGNPQTETPAFAFQSAWKKEYEQMLSDFHAMEKGLPPALRSSLNQCLSALDLAIQSGETADKHPNQALLWQIQEGLVRYALAYERVAKAAAEGGENKF
jgi:stage II sporulation protein B